MTLSDQKMDASEDARHENVFEDLMNILSKDKHAQDMMARLNAAANDSGLTKEQYQKTKETVFLIATLNNPEAFQTLSDSVWNKITKGV